MNIKILDCTLRDGGYINNWFFGLQNIKKIIANLSKSKIDIIECGFLKDLMYSPEQSLFSSFSELQEILPRNNQVIYTLMVNFGEISIDKIPICDNSNLGIRIAFKKEKLHEALDFCQKIKDKGYKTFINPMQTITYSKSELLDCIQKVNKIKPYTFTIVDTTGSMKKNDILSLYDFVDENLCKDINIGFHSHNNLKLSFSNAQAMLEQNKNRLIIIDTTVFGMGRGAGNICTEFMTQYLNDNYDKQYNILPILKTINEQINPIFNKTPWGYSVPYYLAALNYCHPNYAKFLIDKKSISIEDIDYILKRIPDNKKSTYDEEFISRMCQETLNSVVV